LAEGAGRIVEIVHSDDLYRLIDPDWIEKDGSVTSQTYRVDRETDGFHHVSVYLARLTTPEAILQMAWKNHRLGIIAARVPLRLRLNVIHTPELAQQAHCDIVGNITESLRKRLAEETTIWTPQQRC
jgi:hypothetical protein